MEYLKQSTAIEVKLGPFLDDTDGKTPETALTITQADVRLAKGAGDWAQKNEATSLVHEENGWYRCLLDATDTATLGTLKLAINESGALPVWETYVVLAANVYDALIAASDLLQVDLQEIEGDSQSSIDLKDFADAGYDPATNKVEGVKLADVLTTYTGNTPQTGDVFPLASTEIADIKNKTDQLVFTTANRVDATAVTVSDKTGYALSVAGIAAIWDALLTGITTVGSIGKLIKDNIDALISSRATPAQVNTEATNALNTYDPPTSGELVTEINSVQTDVAAIKFVVDLHSIEFLGGVLVRELDAGGYQSVAEAVLNALTANHLVVGSVGKRISDNLDATVSSRSSHSAADVWASGSRTLTSFGTLVADVATSVWAAVSRTITGTVTVGTNNDKTGYDLSTAGVDAIWDDAVDGAVTARQSLRLANSANAGKTNGALGPTFNMRDIADTKDRVSATVDANGNRTAVTRDLT